MYFQYGAFAFEPGEVALQNFVRRYIRSPRDQVVREVRLLAVTFSAIRNGQAALRTRYNEILAALVDGDYTAGFYHTDNSPSAIWVPSTADDANNFTGVQIDERPGLRAIDGADYATHLDGTFAVRAEYNVGIAASIISWDEEVTVSGGSGPNIEAIEQDQGPALLVATTQQTAVIIRQSGAAVGRQTWPQPAPPYFTNEVSRARQISRRSPRRVGFGLTDFTTRWSYTFLATGGVTGYPGAQ